MSDARSYGRKSTLRVDALEQQLSEGPEDGESENSYGERVLNL